MYILLNPGFISCGKSNLLVRKVTFQSGILLGYRRLTNEKEYLISFSTKVSKTGFISKFEMKPVLLTFTH